MHIELPKKRYYRIGEVADAFGVPTSMIRYWEQEFDMIKPKKNSKGDRMFTDVDIEKLKLVYHLAKEQGYSLEGVRKKLREQPKKTAQQVSIINKLEAIKTELIKIKNQL
ncbi:MerR family transcriptional regulator [Wenyingzhuangia sp. 2_MG-2023]|uniref:MerR family transcriptional regulator n=1 Tax=Wenyingzhuangia sp. 2_MG-2023 TaxID=3062639 RepID=UPI0026E391DE|nr:MerR family transcriptional regulator [Wenyingzhuangia sp. 2_MG-2023]MDO6738036.1 MerR family transcriptional regulator [Wenyingzhuangia sp. 2_MG-2023]MDO6802610.1 MerR family transcriptional regulator [Wenyingzhuangia sp. 1_MG-2023]